MDAEKKNLYAFGYGLGLLIPLIVTLHSIDHGFTAWMVIGLLVSALFLITRMILFKPILNSWILITHPIIFIQGINLGFSNLSLFFLGLSVLIAFVTIIKVKLLKPIYVQWMKLAHFIGMAITGIILSLMFYLVFGIVGIILRLIKKDLLDRKIDKSRESYWINREPEVFEKKNYLRQF